MGRRLIRRAPPARRRPRYSIDQRSKRTAGGPGTDTSPERAVSGCFPTRSQPRHELEELGWQPPDAPLANAEHPEQQPALS